MRDITRMVLFAREDEKNRQKKTTAKKQNNNTPNGFDEFWNQQVELTF